MLQAPLSVKLLQGHSLHPLFSLRYTITHELGQGGHGVVLAGHRRTDGVPVAMKFILKKSLTASSWVSISHMERIPLEVYILSHCKHTSIISLMDYFDNGDFVYIVMELHGSPWQKVLTKESQLATRSGSSICSTSSSESIGTVPSTLTHAIRVPSDLKKQGPRDLFE